MAARIRVEEVLRRLAIDDPGLLRALRSEGLFERDLLEEPEAEELRVAACLMVDLGVNAAGVEVVLRMRRRLLVLEGRTRDSLRRLLEESEER